MSEITAEFLAKKYHMLSVGEVRALKKMAERVPEGGTIVNIGAGSGTSALAFLEARPDCRMFTIDKRKGKLIAELSAISGTSCQWQENYRQIKGESVEVAKGWNTDWRFAGTGLIDLLFIDDDHSPDYLAEEIEAWEDHVRDGGMIMFHDYGTVHPPHAAVKAVVDAWMEKRGLRKILRERFTVAVPIPAWGRYLEQNDLDYYVQMLAEGKPFGFSRFSDGEWLALLGHIGQKNSNGCTFTLEVQDALFQVLENYHPYEHTVTRIAREKLGAEIGAFIEEYGIATEWTLGNVFEDAMKEGRLWPLINQLRSKRVMYVGPAYLKQIHEKFFRLVGYVEIPPQDAIKERDKIVANIIDMMAETDAEVIGFSGGHHAKVFIDEVWRLVTDQVTLIDFGSVWDGMLGVKSRKYIRQGAYDFEALFEKNIRGRPLDGESPPLLECANGLQPISFEKTSQPTLEDKRASPRPAQRGQAGLGGPLE